MMGEGEEFLLKWHDHHNSFFQLVEDLVAREQLCDVTLSCGDVILNAHSLMLSVCSPYFRMLLSESQHREKHHIIHLNGVPGKLMQQLLVYMYRGEISIAQDELGPLIETARCLQIKGLSLASTEFPDSRKRPPSQPQPENGKPKERKLTRKLSPVKAPVPEICNIEAQTNHLVIEEEEEITDSLDRSQYPGMDVNNSQYPGMDESFREIKPSNQLISLPMLPKPLSILKTAETRTYLSKLIWLGNGGKRPQYGNPETKPQWWPQHVLPWEEMKKMGGRKSQELSHINYTEILKQCLAAGYEYFGYDPSTYYCTETSFSSMSHGSEDDSTQGAKVNGDDLNGQFSPDRSETKPKSDEDPDFLAADRNSSCSSAGLQSPPLPGTRGLHSPPFNGAGGFHSTPVQQMADKRPPDLISPVMSSLPSSLPSISGTSLSGGVAISSIPGSLACSMDSSIPGLLQQPSLAKLTHASAIAAQNLQTAQNNILPAKLTPSVTATLSSASGLAAHRQGSGLPARVNQDKQDPSKSIACK